MNSLTIGNESASRRPPLRKFGSACVEKIVIRPVTVKPIVPGTATAIGEATTAADTAALSVANRGDVR